MGNATLSHRIPTINWDPPRNLKALPGRYTPPSQSVPSWFAQTCSRQRNANGGTTPLVLHYWQLLQPLDLKLKGKLRLFKKSGQNGTFIIATDEKRNKWHGIYEQFDYKEADVWLNFYQKKLKINLQDWKEWKIEFKAQYLSSKP